MLQFLHIFSKQFFSLDEHRILFESHHLYDKSFLHIFNNLIHLSVLFGIPITLQKAIKLDFHLIHNSVGNVCIRRPRPFRYWNNLYEDRIAYQMDMCHSTICATQYMTHSISSFLYCLFAAVAKGGDYNCALTMKGHNVQLSYFPISPS